MPCVNDFEYIEVTSYINERSPSLAYRKAEERALDIAEARSEGREYTLELVSRTDTQMSPAAGYRPTIYGWVALVYKMQYKPPFLGF